MNKKRKELDTNIVSQSQLAVLIGKTRQLVNQYYKDGRLVKSHIDGKFLAKESIERIEKTKHLNGRAREWSIAGDKAAIEAKIEGAEYTELKEQVHATQLDLNGNDARELFDNARALREKSLALREAAEYEKFIGELVSKEAVEKIVFERARQFRDGMMASKRRVSPELKVAVSVTEIESVLDREFRLLLENFSKLPVIK